MNRFLVAVGSLALLLLASCAVKAETAVGDRVRFNVVCADAATVIKHADKIVSTKDYAASTEMLREDIREGRCFGLPGMMESSVEEVAKEYPAFVDSDKDNVELAVVRVKGAWTIRLKVLDPST